MAEDLEQRIKGAEYSIRRTLIALRQRLDSVEHALDHGRAVSDVD